MKYPERWTNKLPAGRTWHHPDGTTSAWRMAGSECRIQTTDPERIKRLDRLSRVSRTGYAVVGGPWVLYQLSCRKMNTQTVRRILVGDAAIGGRIERVSGSNSTAASFGSLAPGVAPS